jgi:hypothetical protein
MKPAGTASQKAATALYALRSSGKSAAGAQAKAMSKSKRLRVRRAKPAAKNGSY